MINFINLLKKNSLILIIISIFIVTYLLKTTLKNNIISKPKIKKFKKNTKIPKCENKKNLNKYGKIRGFFDNKYSINIIDDVNVNKCKEICDCYGEKCKNFGIHDNSCWFKNTNKIKNKKEHIIGDKSFTYYKKKFPINKKFINKK